MRALIMASAKQPTRRTRHMDIKAFSLQEWVEEDLIIFKSVNTTNNIADGYTKPLGKNLFHKHNGILMGKQFKSYYSFLWNYKDARRRLQQNYSKNI